MAASGAPDRNENHAQNIADVSLQLIKHVRSLKLPSGLGIRIRIGNIFRIQFPRVFRGVSILERSSLISREFLRDSFWTSSSRRSGDQDAEVLFLRRHR